MQLRLIDVPPTTPSRGARLRALCEQHGILTHRAACRERGQAPWMALLPVAADAGRDLFDIIGDSARLYEESGRVAFGEGQLSTVRELCRKNGIECDL